MSLIRSFGLLWMAMFLFCPGWAQESSQAKADELFKARKWADAAEAYHTVVKDEPNNANAWNQLGMSYFWLKQYGPAIEALKSAAAISQNASTMYNIACAYALSQRSDDALDWLEKSIASNFSPFVYPEKDSDLKILHDLPRFKQLITPLDKKRRPCQYSVEARQFDFWLGEWDVFNPQGQQAGTSLIESVSEGCGILEQWTNRGGTTGTSLNFYDAGTGKWHQYWMGPTGVATRYEGEYRDGAIRYRAESPSNDGKKILLRLTFFHVDEKTVRQFAEQSTDGGRAWTTQYDFKYVRKNDEK